MCVFGGWVENRVEGGWFLLALAIIQPSRPPSPPTHPPPTIPQMILAGRSGERCAPTDEAISEFVAALPHPAMANILKGAKRVGDIRNYERTANFRR